ncbi:hypothetical protein SAMN04488589_0505 [Methanolobus vulcani]|uniref:Uncharacterized protein n=1 Tax=Methanolobus vulcani TaxID=38026 RepID=A0A7Z7FBX4_9EURY|nr:hypothetical protein [Methanolobus vulcani]SDF43365.1 hypothetical protein SAMN04488589_0505 [Methanolobus vulcani]
MSDFNKYGIRQVGERVRLPGISVSVSEKQKDDGSTVRWAQLSKFNKHKDEYENFSIFADDLELLGLKIPDILSSVRGGVLHGQTQ